MTPDLGRALAQLCRAGHGAPLDRAQLVAAFARGVFEREPVAPGELLEVLNRAGIDARQWLAAVRVSGRSFVLATARRRLVRARFLRRHRVAGWFS